MMEVNRNNYEEKIIDYMDGKLPSVEIDALFNFLSQNPDLMDEYILLTGSDNIESSKITAPFKNNLKRTRADIISEEKLNHLLVAHLENTQTKDEQKELVHLLSIDPSIKNEIASFNRTILLPDESIIFPGRNELKRSISLYPPLYYYAAAAIIVLLLSIPFLIKQHAGDTENIVATADQKKLFNLSHSNGQVTINHESLKVSEEHDFKENRKPGKNNKKKLLAPIKQQKAIQKQTQQSVSETIIARKINKNELLAMIDPMLKVQSIEGNIQFVSIINTETVDSTILQQNKVANYVSTGNKILERLFNKKLPVTYTYKENQKQKGYVFAAGGFEFSRSRSKKNHSQN